MPSRIVRDTLLESDRWLSLANPAERLAYVALLLKADDLATADASDGQLIRLWRETCNAKGKEDAARILQALVDADLVRVYEADGKRFVFIPRFRQRFRAATFRRPPPPENLLHDETDILKNVRQIKERLSEMADSCPPHVGHVPDSCRAPASVVYNVVNNGDVDEGGKTARKRATPTPKDFEVNDQMRQWAVGKGLDPKAVDPETERFLDHHRSKGSTFKDWDAAWRKWISNSIDWAKPNQTKASRDRYVRA